MNLTGTWVSDDYDCPWGVMHTEIVKVIHDGVRIAGTKVTGDDCVVAGNLTFSGTINAEGSTTTVVWVVGHTWAPATGQHPGTLSIVRDDILHATAPSWREMHFRRVRPEAPWQSADAW